MPVKQSHYETLLAEYTNPTVAIALLKQHRPYLEMIPSLRRPDESLIAIPLPIVRLRDGVSYSGIKGVSIAPGQAVCLPCDLGIFMCDPEWKVKTGVEIFVFIHRPHEDFYALLSRWRETQVWLDKEYEWVMPHQYKHIYSQEAEGIYPLFVLFSETSEIIKKGLKGSGIPFVVQSVWELATEESDDSLAQIQFIDSSSQQEDTEISEDLLEDSPLQFYEVDSPSDSVAEQKWKWDDGSMVGENF